MLGGSMSYQGQRCRDTRLDGTTLNKGAITSRRQTTVVSPPMRLPLVLSPSRSVGQ